MSELKPVENWPDRQGELFKERLAAWKRLRGELDTHCLAIPEETGDTYKHYEAKFDDISGRLEDAARLVMTTHAPWSWMVWQKFQILEAAYNDEQGHSTHTDCRHFWMIGAIKADIAALGIGRLPNGRGA